MIRGKVKYGIMIFYRTTKELCYYFTITAPTGRPIFYVSKCGGVLFW